MPGAVDDVWLARGQVLLGVFVPLLLALLIGTADLIEGPRAAFVGALTFIPMLSAVFGSVRQTAAIGAFVLVAAIGVGLVSDDGRTATQVARLAIIVVVVLVATTAAGIRVQRDEAYRSAVAELARQKEMSSLTGLDDLTGLPNRRGAVRHIEQAAQRLDPVTQLRTLALADVDGLNAVNDEYGNQIGDDFLHAVAGRLQGAVSAADLVARWSGDEFLLIVDLPLEMAEQVLKRARQAVVRDPVRTSVAGVSASVSMGITSWAPGETLDTVVRRASSALDRAKASGLGEAIVVPAEAVVRREGRGQPA